LRPPATRRHATTNHYYATSLSHLEPVYSLGVRYSAVAMPLCAYDLKIEVDAVIYDMLQTGEMERLISAWIEKWLYS